MREEGRSAKAANEHFERAVEILRDDISWNDAYGYELLARVLFINGQEGKAKTAASLKLFFYDGYNREDGSATEAGANDPGRPLSVLCGVCADSGGPKVEYDTPLYTCTTCTDVDLCKGCYDNLRNRTAEDRVFVCNPNHDFLKSPAEGLNCIKNDMMTINGGNRPIAAWLEEVQKEWKTGLYFQA